MAEQRNSWTIHGAGKQLLRYMLVCLLFVIGGKSVWSQMDSVGVANLLKASQKALEDKAWGSAAQFAQDALNEGEKYRDPTTLMHAHRQLGEICFAQEDLACSLRHYLQALALRKNQEASFSLSTLHMEIAALYEAWPIWEKAYESYEAALNFATEEEKELLEIFALRGMARNSEADAKAAMAISHYQSLRRIYQEQEDAKAELEILREIIRIQKEYKFTENALASNQEALGLNEREKDTLQMIISLNNIGVLHRQLDQPEEALTFFIQAAELEELSNPRKGSNPITLSNVGIIYQNLDDYLNSLKYLLKAETQIRAEARPDSSLLSNVLNLISIIYLNNNELSKAFEYNEESTAIAQAMEDAARLQLAYETRSLIHEEGREYDEALQYFRLHTQLKDSLAKRVRTEEEQELMLRFSAEQTEKEMSLLLVNKEIEELKLRQNQMENERLKQENEIKEQQLKFAQQEIQRQEAEQALVLAQNQLLSEQKDRQIALLEKEQSEQELQLTAERLKREQQDRAITQAEKEQVESVLALQEKDFQIQNQQEKIIRNTVLGILLTSLIVLFLIIRNSRLRRKANEILSKRKQELEETLEKLKTTQSQLVQSEKMASLGELTAGVAHEINNPLNFVMSNTHALKLDLAELKDLLDEVHRLKEKGDEEQVKTILQKVEEYDTEFLNEEVQQLVESIERGAQRTKNIVLGLRTFSRSADDEFVLADIHEGLDSTLTILNSKLKNRIEVIKNYGKLPRIACQFDKLNQVFMNILGNAIQAIPGEGRISIETSRGGQEVLINISDNGQGIPRELRERIFEPFFTTKPIGQGTGLGLSISYGIIENHGGRILVDSEPGEGTSFQIYLPIERG